MARRLMPSSFVCDCGHQSHFFENTVREMEAASHRRRKPMRLLNSEADEHAIEFEHGRATAVICPKLGRREIAG
jgi:hypothetical protein